jgi:hypothetical protein
MSIDTVSLSDIGQSLVTIEAEIKSNQASIAYYQREIDVMHDKNAALADLAKALIKGALPLTLNVGRRGL